MDPEHEEHGDAAEQRAGKVGTVDPEPDPVDAERGREQRAGDAEGDPDPLDRLRPEAGEDVQRQPEQAQRRVAGSARPRRMGDVDLDDRGAAGEDERLRELLLADRRQHRHDGAAPVGVEGAAEVGDRDAGEAPEHPVDQPRRQRPAPRVLARDAAAARDVGAALDRRDQARDVLGLVLEVAVHRHDDLAPGARETRVHRRVLAEVALEADGAHARVGGVQALDRGPRSVGRAVVDEDQLERLSVECRYGAPIELLDRALLVQERHDDGKIRSGHGWRGAYRRCLARRASRPGLACAGLPDRRGDPRARGALDAARHRGDASGRRDGHADPDPGQGVGARADLEQARRALPRAAGSRPLDLPLLQARRRVRALVRQLRAAAAPDAAGLRHLRPQARPDRDAGRDVPLEGRGRARAGRRARDRRCRGGPGRGGARPRRVAVPDRLGGLATRPHLADPAAAGRLGPGLRRRGPLAAFVGLGLLWGGWAALVPAVQDAVGASKGTLGLALLFVAVGSLPAMLLTGRELDRRGTSILPWLIVGLAVAAVLPAFAGSVPVLALCLVALGVGTGAMDVAMNAAVSELEVREGTRLMQLAHGLYSAGVLVGALAVGLARQAGAGRARGARRYRGRAARGRSSERRARADRAAPWTDQPAAAEPRRDPDRARLRRGVCDRGWDGELGRRLPRARPRRAAGDERARAGCLRRGDDARPLLGPVAREPARRHGAARRLDGRRARRARRRRVGSEPAGRDRGVLRRRRGDLDRGTRALRRRRPPHLARGARQRGRDRDDARLPRLPRRAAVRGRMRPRRSG